MRKALILLMLLVLIIGLIPAAMAQDAEEECPEEEALALGAHFWATDLNTVTLTATAVGIDEFDPVVTVLDSEGEVKACNDNNEAVADLALDLEGMDEVVASDKSASVDVKVENDERLDLEVVVTSVDGTYGEFVLLINGTSVYPGSDTDLFKIVTSEEQIANEAPLDVYLANLNPADNGLDVEFELTSGEEFKKACISSSSELYCEGVEEDLSSSTVTLKAEKPLSLSGNDAYVLFDLTETSPAEYELEVGSGGGTFGPYYVIIHTGVGNPAEAE